MSILNTVWGYFFTPDNSEEEYRDHIRKDDCSNIYLDYAEDIDDALLVEKGLSDEDIAMLDNNSDYSPINDSIVSYNRESLKQELGNSFNNDKLLSSYKSDYYSDSSEIEIDHFAEENIEYKDMVEALVNHKNDLIYNARTKKNALSNKISKLNDLSENILRNNKFSSKIDIDVINKEELDNLLENLTESYQEYENKNIEKDDLCNKISKKESGLNKLLDILKEDYDYFGSKIANRENISQEELNYYYNYYDCDIDSIKIDDSEDQNEDIQYNNSNITIRDLMELMYSKLSEVEDYIKDFKVSKNNFINDLDDEINSLESDIDNAKKGVEDFFNNVINYLEELVNNEAESINNLGIEITNYYSAQNMLSSSVDAPSIFPDRVEAQDFIQEEYNNLIGDIE